MADEVYSSESDDEIGHYSNSNNPDKDNHDDEINERSPNALIEKDMQRCGSLELDMDKEEESIAK
jgi:hypothetical protein